VSRCFPKGASSGLAPKDVPPDMLAELLFMMAESRLDFIMKVRASRRIITASSRASG
jgi:hypothetical protein